MPQLEEIEDIDDIDNLDLDIAEFDPDLVTAVAPRNEPDPVKKAASKPSKPAKEDPMVEILRQQQRDFAKAQNAPRPDPVRPRTREDLTDEEKKQLNSMQALYPCYWDSQRSVKQGRRAPMAKCVANPLANTVLHAVRSLGFVAVLEPDKTHPQDFGNPGRVKIAFKFEGKPEGRISSKRQLLNAVGDYLLQHPTTLDTVKELPGPPDLEATTYTPLEVPKVKGFTMNTIVPLHSPLTMKNPQTAGAYMKMHNQEQPQQVKQKKPKIQRIRL